MRKAVFVVVAALAGIAALVIAKWSVRPSDSLQSWHHYAMLPPLCIVSAILGYCSPHKAWIWGFTPLLAQWIWEAFAPGSPIGKGNLGPFAYVVTLAIYSLSAIPGMLAAELAAYLSRRSTKS